MADNPRSRICRYPVVIINMADRVYFLLLSYCETGIGIDSVAVQRAVIPAIDLYTASSRMILCVRSKYSILCSY